MTFRARQRVGPSCADVPIIAMSAGENLAAAEPVLAPCESLPKPFDLDALLDAVARCADGVSAD